MSISTALTKPTDDAKILVALRDAEFQTRPDHLKGKPGLEMHHEYTPDFPDGFKSICEDFITAKGKTTLLGNISSDKLIDAGLRHRTAPNTGGVSWLAAMQLFSH